MQKRFLILGDVLTLLIVTVIGFVSHRETDASFLPRAAAMFVALASGWFLLAPAMGLFDEERVRNVRHLWRPALTGLFAGQLAATLRGLLLHSDVKPVFAVVLSLTAAFGMFAWRSIALWLAKRK